MSLLPFCQWLAATQGSIALHESLYMYPLVESVHVLTLCLFVGMSVLLDLRLLGLTLRRVPVSEVTARLLPWMQAGFVVMIVTGLLLFYAIPVRSYQNVFFRLKMIATCSPGSTRGCSTSACIGAAPNGISIAVRQAPHAPPASRH
jgi:hypothetical protein